MIRSSGCRNFTGAGAQAERSETMKQLILAAVSIGSLAAATPASAQGIRSEEHTSELQSLMRISYAVFCLKKTKKTMPNYTRQSQFRLNHRLCADTALTHNEPTNPVTT